MSTECVQHLSGRDRVQPGQCIVWDVIALPSRDREDVRDDVIGLIRSPARGVGPYRSVESREEGFEPLIVPD